jgi:hypothetical protein
VRTFIHEGDNVSSLIQALSATKSAKDVMDYYFRCIYSAVQLQDVDLRAIQKKKIIYSKKYGDSNNYRYEEGDSYLYQSSGAATFGASSSFSSSSSSSQNPMQRDGSSNNIFFQGDSFARSHHPSLQMNTTSSREREDISTARANHPYAALVSDSISIDSFSRNVAMNLGGKPRARSSIFNRHYVDFTTADDDPDLKALDSADMAYEDAVPSENVSVDDYQASNASRQFEAKVDVTDAVMTNKALETLIRVRTAIDDVAFADVFNALICYQKHILSPAELVSHLPSLWSSLVMMVCLYSLCV